MRLILDTVTFIWAVSFDRQIIAQALVEIVPVVTPDETFHLYDGLEVVW